MYVFLFKEKNRDKKEETNVKRVFEFQMCFILLLFKALIFIQAMEKCCKPHIYSTRPEDLQALKALQQSVLAEEAVRSIEPHGCKWLVGSKPTEWGSNKWWLV